jgi:hypothetical protein
MLLLSDASAVEAAAAERAGPTGAVTLRLLVTKSDGSFQVKAKSGQFACLMAIRRHTFLLRLVVQHWMDATASSPPLKLNSSQLLMK